MSARPLRAPCVEMKYYRTLRPSRKFEVIGVSMIEPSGSHRVHAGQLADLRCGTICARVSHHVDGIERDSIDRLAFAVLDLLHGELVHHRLGDSAGAAPDIEHCCSVRRRSPDRVCTASRFPLTRPRRRHEACASASAPACRRCRSRCRRRSPGGNRPASAGRQRRRSPRGRNGGKLVDQPEISFF